MFFIYLLLGIVAYVFLRFMGELLFPRKPQTEEEQKRLEWADRNLLTPTPHPSPGAHAGYYRGKHYSAYAEEVKEFKRSGDLDRAETLLLDLVEVVEADAHVNQWGVPPAYYWHLAIIYRKRKDFDAEIAILTRYLNAPHGDGWQPGEFAERLERAHALKERMALCD